MAARILKKDEKAVLAAMINGPSFYGDFCFFPFRYLCNETGLERPVVRRICRYLARRGLAQYQRGLWTEDGEPVGSGYGATREGAQLLDQMEARTA